MEELAKDKTILFNLSFIRNVLIVCVPKQLQQLPMMEIYDESSDPNDHFSRFKSALSHRGANGLQMCKAFLLSLKQVALKWFQWLSRSSISSWSDRRVKVHYAFATSKERPKTEADLKKIKQGV